MAPMSDIVMRLRLGGARMLALRFSATGAKGAGPALTAAMAEEGRLVAGGASVPWRFESTVEDGDSILLVGPEPVGFGDATAEAAHATSLDDSKDMETGLSRLLVLTRALFALQAEGLLPRGIVSSSILFSDDGAAILVLPPNAAARALTASGAPARSAAFARLSSPRSDGPEADASFLLALAAYRIATGKHAFEREAGEPSSVAGSTPSGAPAVLAAPRLDRGLAALVDKALADPARAALGEWLSVLGSASSSGWIRELPPEEEAELSRRREAAEAGERSRRRRADFLRKRGGVLVASTVAILALALVAGDMLRAERDKPDYSRLAPRELVRRYYLAVDGLDLDSLEACGDGKAIKDDRDMLINLVVITKTRTAYEGKSPVVRALDWAAAGKPELAPTYFLYGITGLSISDEGGNGANRAFLRADYSLWSLDRPDSAPVGAASIPTESRRSDTLTLDRGRKGWRIVALERRILR
jgi:hypothetical protein